MLLVKQTLSVLSISLILGILGCKDSSPVVVLELAPGKLSLTLLKGLEKQPVLAANLGDAIQSDSLSFDLGDIKGTTRFYFVLNNIGGTAVSNAQVSMVDSSFTVYPPEIDTLFPNPHFQLNLIKVIDVTAIHGTVLSGSGFARLMEKGLNSGALKITGKTLQANSTAGTITLTATVHVFARVMDLAFFDGTNIINLKKPNGSVYNGGLYYGSPLFFWYIHDTLSVHNSGNTPVALWDIGDDKHDTLQANDVYTFKFLHGGYTAALDGMGVVSDNTIFPRLIDGKTYFSFFRR